MKTKHQTLLAVVTCGGVIAMALSAGPLLETHARKKRLKFCQLIMDGNFKEARHLLPDKDGYLSEDRPISCQDTGRFETPSESAPTSPFDEMWAQEVVVQYSDKRQESIYFIYTYPEFTSWHFWRLSFIVYGSPNP